VKRLVDETGDTFERALLRSSAGDTAPDAGAQTAFVALQQALVAFDELPGSITPAAPTDPSVSATGGAVGGAAWAPWQWLGLGALVGSIAGAGAMAGYQARSTSAATGELKTAAVAVAASAPQVTSTEPAPVERNEAPGAVAGSEPNGVPDAGAPPAPPRDVPRAQGAAHPAESAAADSAAPPSAASTLAAEAAQIERARRALASSAPDAALALLDRYDSESPTHALAPDAQALRIQAERARGNSARARGLAKRFLAAHPNDPHAERVRRILAELSAP